MKMLLVCREKPVVSSQRDQVDLVKRIRKLRWIGMQEEAARLEAALSGAATDHAVIAERPDTD